MKRKLRILKIALWLPPILVGAVMIGVLAFYRPPPASVGSSSPQKTPKIARITTYSAEDAERKDFRGPPGAVTMAFVGDIMLWDKMEEPITKNGVDYPFLGVAKVLTDSDLAAGNLECPVAEDAAKRLQGRYLYKVPPLTLPGLLNAGFDVVSLDNNHIRDCGDDGVRETIRCLDEAGLRHFGAGENLAAARRATVVDVKGLKVAFVGIMSPEVYFHDIPKDPGRKLANKKHALMRDVGATDIRPGAVVVDKESEVRTLVTEARRGADLVVVFAHWGIRYHRPVYELQERLGHAAIDAGADLVVGCHAHFWQPAEVYKGKAILYGLGNFAFGSFNGNADEALLARAIVRKGRIKSVELYPLYTHNRKTNLQTKLMKGAAARNLLKRLAEWSGPRGAKIAVSGDMGLLKLPR